MSEEPKKEVLDAVENLAQSIGKELNDFIQKQSEFDLTLKYAMIESALVATVSAFISLASTKGYEFKNADNFCTLVKETVMKNIKDKALGRKD